MEDIPQKKKKLIYKEKEEKKQKHEKLKAKEKSDDEDEDEVTIKKKVTKKIDEKEISQWGVTSNTILTLSGALKKKAINTEKLYKVIDNQRIITQEILDLYSSELETSTLVSKASSNQTLCVVEEKSDINFVDTTSIISYIRKQSQRYNEVYSLQFVAQGGESIVLRADMKLPMEVVIKSVLPERLGTQEALCSILTESHLIQLAENKEHVVQVYEEIIELKQDSQEIVNYLVIVEQAVNDLKNILNIWTSYEESHSNLEFFSNAKLFYFLYKTCQAIEYLHSQNIYYGDCKEQNLLVFRDYGLKLGDFGVSVKFSHTDDPSEALYEVKGATPGYTQKEILQNFNSKFWSKNELLSNDYYSLEVTFNNIKAFCQRSFSQSRLQEEQSQREINIFKEHFDEKSYFCQLLEELSLLDPQSYPLRVLLEKYSSIICNENRFLLSFCDDLISSEKYQALSNVLTLWKHSFIPRTLCAYFRQEEILEFPFLNTNLSSVEEISIKERHNLQEDEVIESVKSYIEMSGEDTLIFLEYVDKIVRYKGCLLEDFYNSFYRKLFSRYYWIEANGEYRCLMDWKLSHDWNFRKFLWDYPMYKDLEGRELNQEIIQSQDFFILTMYLSFMAHTTSQNQELILQIENYCINGFLISSQLARQYRLSNPICQFYFLKKILIDAWPQQPIYEKYIEDYTDLLQVSGYYTNWHILATKLQNLKKMQIGKEDKRKELKNMSDLKRSSNLWHKAFFHCQVQILLSEIQADLVSDSEKLVNNLYSTRKALKNTYGELGDQMSLNAYKIYKLIKKIQLEKGDESYRDNEAFGLIRKSFNYSNRDQKQQFIIDLLKEYQHKGFQKEFTDALESVKDVSPLYYTILLEYFNKSQMNLNEKEQMKDQIINPEVSRQISTLGTHPDFHQSMFTFYGCNYDFGLLDVNYMIMKNFFASAVPKIISEIKERNQSSLDINFRGNRVQFWDRGGQHFQQRILINNSWNHIDLLLSNFVIQQLDFQFDNYYYFKESFMGETVIISYKGKQNEFFGSMDLEKRKYILERPAENVDLLIGSLNEYGTLTKVGSGFSTQLWHGYYIEGYFKDFQLVLGRMCKENGERMISYVDMKEKCKNGTHVQLHDGYVYIEEYINGSNLDLHMYYFDNGLFIYELSSDISKESPEWQRDFLECNSDKLDLGHKINITKKETYSCLGKIAQIDYVIESKSNRVMKSLSFSENQELVGYQNGNARTIFKFTQDGMQQDLLESQDKVAEVRSFYLQGAIQSITTQTCQLDFFKNGMLKSRTDLLNFITYFYDISGQLLYKKHISEPFPQILYYPNGRIKGILKQEQRLTLYHVNGHVAFSNDPGETMGIFDEGQNLIKKHSNFIHFEITKNKVCVKNMVERYEYGWNDLGQLIYSKDGNKEEWICNGGRYRIIRNRIGDREYQYSYFDMNMLIGSCKAFKVRSHFHQYSKSGKILNLITQQGNVLLEEEYSSREQHCELLRTKLFYPDKRILREADYKCFNLLKDVRYFPSGTHFKIAEHHQEHSSYKFYDQTGKEILNCQSSYFAPTDDLKLGQQFFSSVRGYNNSQTLKDREISVKTEMNCGKHQSSWRWCWWPWGKS